MTTPTPAPPPLSAELEQFSREAQPSSRQIGQAAERQNLLPGQAALAHGDARNLNHLPVGQPLDERVN